VERLIALMLCRSMLPLASQTNVGEIDAKNQQYRIAVDIQLKVAIWQRLLSHDGDQWIFR
jgi:hypothetical protein